MVKIICQDDGQHLNNFLVGHNQKVCCRINTTKEPIGGNGLERLVVTTIESQPIGCSYHIAYIHRFVELGKHKEEGSRVGN